MSRKYINKFDTTADALAAEDLYAPQVAYVGDVDKTFFSGAVGNNKKVAFEGSGDTLALAPVVDYFTVEVVSATNQNLELSGSYTDWNLEYSKNGGEWTAWTTGITGLNSGDKIRLRGTGNTPTSSKNIKFFNSGVFSSGKQVKVYGHVMSLYDYTGDFSVMPDYACKEMFKQSSGLISAENLFNGVTTVGQYCCQYMFNSCSSLTTTPELPATTLTQYCYSNMFNSCSSLTTTPELPATTLAEGCYGNMFQNCTSLTTAPELPATTLAGSCYGSMFQGCSSLTTAPELPATTPADYCYNNMFQGCSSLNYVKHHVTSWNTFNSLKWLEGVAASGTVECPTASTIPSDSTSGIPTGWTRVNF